MNLATAYMTYRKVYEKLVVWQFIAEMWIGLIRGVHTLFSKISKWKK